MAAILIFSAIFKYLIFVKLKKMHFIIPYRDFILHPTEKM